MRSILIKDTTREEREQIIRESLNCGGGGCENCSSCWLGGGSPFGIYQDYIDGIKSMNVFKYQPVSTTYTVGDTIPTKGKSYNYPDSFDILVMRDSAAVSVRGKTIKSITALDEYEYSGVPVVNGRGFGLEIFSQEDAEKFIAEYKNSLENDKSIYDKWLNFDLYRRVAVK